MACLFSFIFIILPAIKIILSRTGKWHYSGIIILSIGQYGGVYQSVSPSGQPISTGKAVVWKASYHEMENALLNYFYLNLYVNHKPATLSFSS